MNILQKVAGLVAGSFLAAVGTANADTAVLTVTTPNIAGGVAIEQITVHNEKSCTEIGRGAVGADGRIVTVTCVSDVYGSAKSFLCVKPSGQESVCNLIP